MRGDAAGSSRMGPRVQAPPDDGAASIVKFGVQPGVYHRKAHGACFGASEGLVSLRPEERGHRPPDMHACAPRCSGGWCRARRPGTVPTFPTGTHRRYEQRYVHEEASDYISPRLHSVVLDGLKPATTYYYRVSSADGEHWSEVRGWGSVGADPCRPASEQAWMTEPIRSPPLLSAAGTALSDAAGRGQAVPAEAGTHGRCGPDLQLLRDLRAHAG